MVCSNGSALLNKMAAMPIYGNTFKFHLLQHQDRFEAESWYIASGLKVYQFVSNDGRRLTYYFFMARSNFAPIHLYGENIEKQRLIAETYNV